jgi:hypothetical protein
MTQLDLIQSGDPGLSQFFTPAWASALLVERYFSDLSSSDLVVDPCCGKGSFLQAIPDFVPAIGVELDPLLAEEARANTGRRVICGDFCSVGLPEGVTAVVGNPPYVVRLIEGFLSRSQNILPETGRVGFLLPAYSMQTHARVVKWLDCWSMKSELVPRRLFPRLRLPLLFVVFTKNQRRDMVGFALYREACDVDRLGLHGRELMTMGRPGKGIWRAVVDECLEILGGEGCLADIYRVMEPKRPTPNAFWKEKVRQVLQMHFKPLGEGRWAKAA